MLAAMHGGIHEKKEIEKDKIQWKKRHVFFQLLSIVRMSNSRLLSWWAMIQSVANFGWGVGATVGDVNCYWGNCLSSSTRSNRLTSLTGNIVFHYRKLMKQSHAKLFSFDNYQIGQELKDIRGKHASTFFKGTNAHQVC